MVNIAAQINILFQKASGVVKLLAIDRGNSRTKVGIQHKSGDFEMAIFANDAEDELLGHIKNLHFDAAIMSSVAAGNLKRVSEYLQSNGKFISVDSTTPIPIKSEYATPETLGADRIAGAIGTWKLVGNKDVLLIDAGTCINYECVVNNIYKGGAISPGLEMRLKAMHDYTGKLPLLKLPENEIELTGNSTKGCMLSGTILGMVNEIEGFANQYHAKYPAISMVLSGGDGPFLGKYLGEPLKTKKFKAGKGEKAEFTFVNEHFETEAQRRNSKFLEVPLKNSIFAQHKEVVLVGLIEILKYNLNINV